MPDPINYMAMMPQVDLGKSVVEGLQIGGAFRQARQADEAEKAQQQYAADLQAAMSNPSARGFAALTAKYPQQREAFKQSWEMLNKDQQDAEFGTGTQVYSALQNKRPDIAAQLLDEQITAMENSGQDAADLKSIKNAMEVNPQAALGHIGLILSATDPDRWGKMMDESRSAEIAPANLSEAQAKAHAAGVKAKFAESKAAQDLAKGGWDIAKLQSDIGLGRQNASIALMNAQLSKEKNELKKQELQQKVMDAEMKRDETVRLKADEAQGSADNINAVSASVGDLLGDIDALESATGFQAGLPTFPGSQSRAIESKVEQLKSLLTMENLGKLKGAMSDADRNFLVNIGSNLDLKMPDEELQKELIKINEKLPEQMDKLNAKYGSQYTLYKNEPAKDAATGAPPSGAVRRIQ